MPFVVESMSQNDAENYFGKTKGLVYTFQPERTIDHERDLVLLDFGGKGDEGERTGEPPSYFNLLWKGDAVAFEGYYKVAKEGNNRVYDFDVRRFRIPSAISKYESAIRDAIVEALTVYWSVRARQPVQPRLQFPVAEQY
jgi:hypothetical protein